MIRMELIGTRFSGAAGYTRYYREGKMLIVRTGGAFSIWETQTFLLEVTLLPKDDRWEECSVEGSLFQLHVTGGYASHNGIVYALEPTAYPG